jgi:hypothetical protein
MGNGGRDRGRRVRDGKETSLFYHLDRRERENKDYKYANGYKIRRNNINKYNVLASGQCKGGGSSRHQSEIPTLSGEDWRVTGGEGESKGRGLWRSESAFWQLFGVGNQ